MATASDYLALNGRIKVRESELVSDSDLERIIDSPDMEHVMRVIADLDVAEHFDVTKPFTQADVEPAFEAHLDEAFRVIEESAPDNVLVELLRARFEWHNVKSVAKAVLAGRSVEEAPLSSLGSWSVEDMQAVLENEDVPADIALRQEVVDVLRRSKEAGATDPRSIDLLADAALAQDWKRLARAAKSKPVRQFVERTLELQNVRSILRLFAMPNGASIAEQVLVDAPTMSREALLPLVSDEYEGDRVEALKERMRLLPDAEQLQDGVEQALQSREFGLLEKAIDDALMSYVKAGRSEMFGVLPTLGYFLGKERELTNLRIALTGKQFGMKREQIVERLRDLY